MNPLLFNTVKQFLCGCATCAIAAGIGYIFAQAACHVW